MNAPINECLLQKCHEIVLDLHRVSVKQLGPQDKATQMVSNLFDKLKLLRVLGRCGSTVFSEHIHELELDLGCLADQLDRRGLAELALRSWETQANVLMQFASHAPAVEVSSAPPGKAFLDENLAVQKLWAVLEAKAKLLEEVWQIEAAARCHEQNLSTMRTIVRYPGQWSAWSAARWIESAANLYVEVGQAHEAIRLLRREVGTLVPADTVALGESHVIALRCTRNLAKLTAELRNPEQGLAILQNVRQRVQPFFLQGEHLEETDYSLRHVWNQLYEILTLDEPEILFQLGHFDCIGECFIQARALASRLPQPGPILGTELDDERNGVPRGLEERVREFERLPSSSGQVEHLAANIDPQALALRAAAISGRLPDAKVAFSALQGTAHSLRKLGQNGLALTALHHCIAELLLRTNSGGLRCMSFRLREALQQLIRHARMVSGLEGAALVLGELCDKFRTSLSAASTSVRMLYVVAATRRAQFLATLSRLDEALESLDECSKTLLSYADLKGNTREWENRVISLARRQYAILWSFGRCDEANRVRADALDALDRLGRLGTLAKVQTLERLKMLHTAQDRYP